MYFLSIFLVDFDNLTWTLLDSKTHFRWGFVDDSRRAEQVKPDLGFPVEWSIKPLPKAQVRYEICLWSPLACFFKWTFPKFLVTKKFGRVIIIFFKSGLEDVVPTVIKNWLFCILSKIKFVILQHECFCKNALIFLNLDLNNKF